jgi:lipopolysaccharide transport system ATP-binding protein
MAERIVEPQAGEVQVRHAPIRPGHVYPIYPTVYLNKRELDDVTLPENKKMFAVIRDLRDTLTSAYFSFKISHPILGESNANCREVLQQLDLEAGFLHLMENFLPSCAQIQLTWLESDIPVLRYEDLLHSDIELLTELLLGRLKLPLDRDVLESAIVTSRFEAVTQGRSKGIEDLSAHERKGIAGDWRNHFTPRVTKAFRTRFGGLLMAAGYEHDLAW